MLPTTIATVASALTIIDLTIKFAQNLSPEITRALREGQKQIVAKNPQTVEAADEIFVQFLQNSIPISEIETTSQDLKMALSLVTLFEDSIKPHYLDRIPRYGDGVNSVINEAIDNLSKWGCFSAWGKHVEASQFKGRFSSGYIDLLRARSTEHGLRCCKEFMRTFPISIRRWDLFFYTTISSNQWVQKLSFTSGNYFESPNGKELERINLSPFEYNLNYYIISSESFDVLFRYLLTGNDAGLIISGILTDLIEYSRRARGEEIASKSLLDKLKNRFKPD